MGKYNIYPGKFICHTCKEEVKSLRLYASDKMLTWMCSQKHLSEVAVATKKSKKSYE